MKISRHVQVCKGIEAGCGTGWKRRQQIARHITVAAVSAVSGLIATTIHFGQQRERNAEDDVDIREMVVGERPVWAQHVAPEHN